MKFESVAAPSLAGNSPVPIYVAEGLASVASNMLTMGLYFYAHQRFGWGPGRNLLLATCLGIVYTAGTLLSHRITTRLGLRRVPAIALTVMGLAALIALLGRNAPAVVTICVLMHMAGSSQLWSSLEALVCVGQSHAGMARRLAIYNIIWPAISAIALGASGVIVHRWSVGMFLIPAIANLTAVVVLITTRPRRLLPGAAPDRPSRPLQTSASSVEPRGVFPVETPPDDLAPEPELLQLRTQALWLSRIALPATFVVINGMMAMMPSLPLIQRLTPETQTLVGGAWLVARWIGFLFFGWSTWWHTRPRALLGAAALMLLAFLGITLPWPFPNWIDAGTTPWIAWTISWQMLLGLCLALIYSASLYFGMVLSDASAEHSGYHEALIGLGTTLGPCAGAAAQLIGGSDPIWGTVAVALVMGGSVVAATLVALVSPAFSGLRRDGLPRRG